MRRRIPSSCRWSPLFKERWGCCLSIWCSVWHGRESPQVAAKLANHKSPHCSSCLHVFLSHSEFTTLLNTHQHTAECKYTHTNTHTCHSTELSIHLHLECGNEEVGATEMMSLKILRSNGGVPGISVSRFMAKSSKNSKQH